MLLQDPSENVGIKMSNAWDLYDMNVNVFEWVWDSWKEESYKRADKVDPVVNEARKKSVFRGGSWNDPYTSACVYRRFQGRVDYRVHCVGFRFVCCWVFVSYP